MSDENDTMNVTEDGATPADGPGDDRLTALEREKQETYERLLRVTAEFDNYRKRTERERQLLSDAIAGDVVSDLLPVVDDLERALAAAHTGDVDALREGVALIHRQLLDLLRRRGVEPLDAAGQTFDPNWHEAVGYEPAEGRDEGEIIAEVRRGYRIGDRLLRPAQVRVAKA